MFFDECEVGNWAAGYAAGTERAPGRSCLTRGDVVPHLVGLDHNDRAVSLHDLACGEPLGLLLLSGDADVDRTALACARAVTRRPSAVHTWLVAAPCGLSLDAVGIDALGLHAYCGDELHRLFVEELRPARPVAVVLDGARRVLSVFDVEEPAWLRGQADRALRAARGVGRRRSLGAAPVLLVPDVLAGETAAAAARCGTVDASLFQAVVDRYVRAELGRAGFADASELVDARLLDQDSRWPVHRANASPDNRGRRFSIVFTLADQARGGGVCLPGCGPTLHLAGPGGALVYSASLPATLVPPRRGRRTLVAGFLHDGLAATPREQQAHHM